MKILALALVALAAGCACDLDHIALDDSWAPVKRVQRDPTIPAGLYQTRLDVILTADPCDFLAHDSVDREALRKHEVFHALVQQEMGLAAYEHRYAEDFAFRAAQEHEGWHRYIRHVVRSGGEVDAEAIAKVFVEQYRVHVRETALEWVAAEVAAAQRE